MTASKDILKVAVVGPECTGKSELSIFLAKYLNTAWVPEYAREYLDHLNRPYDQRDLLAIAEGQLLLEDKVQLDADRILICDTNLYVVKVWSEFRFGNCDPKILNAIASRKYDLYLLTYVDIPWESDPLREHPDKRHQLYDLYFNEMRNQSVPFVEIKGDRMERRKSALSAIEKLFTD